MPRVYFFFFFFSFGCSSQFSFCPSPEMPAPRVSHNRDNSAAQPRAAELLYSRLSDPGSNQFSLQVSVHTTLNVTDPPPLRSHITPTPPYSLLLPLREERVELGDAVLGVREEVRLHLRAHRVHYVSMRNDGQSRGLIRVCGADSMLRVGCPAPLSAHV